MRVGIRRPADANAHHRRAFNNAIIQVPTPEEPLSGVKPRSSCNRPDTDCLSAFAQTHLQDGADTVDPRHSLIGSDGALRLSRQLRPGSPTTLNPLDNNPWDLFSLAEVRQITTLGKTTIHKLIRAGALQAVKVGRRTVIPRRELERWLRALPAVYPQKSIPSDLDTHTSSVGTPSVGDR